VASHDPVDRSTISTIAALDSWARTDDRAARTAPARAAALRKYEDQVDPDRTLDPAERARRAEYARRAHMLRLARLSAQARRRGDAA